MELKKIFIAGLLLGVCSFVPAVLAQQDTQASESESKALEFDPQLSEVTLAIPQAKPTASGPASQAPEVTPQVPEVTPQVAETAPVVEASQSPESAPQTIVPPQTAEVIPQAAPVQPPVAEAVSPSVEVKTQAPEVKPQTVPAKTETPEVKPLPNLFAENFFASAGNKLDNKITEIRGFPVLKAHSREQNAEYAVVTDFGGGAVRSRYLSGLKDTKAIDAYIKSHLQTAEFQGVEIRQLSVPGAKGETTTLFWVGDKAFATAEAATGAIVSTKMMVESQGGNFAEAVRAAPVYIPEPEPVIEIKTPAQFKKEEELILKFTDQMGIGEKMFGVFQGVPCGENITWQSFGETSWRLTNLASNHFDTQVGYWTNRIVFKGIRFPLHTIDPFIEETVSLQSDSTTYASNLQLFAGLEWRPLARNPFLYNFRPFGDIPILEWMRNYRFYIKYGDQRNLKNEVENSKDYDLIWGVQCYYEWGTELPPLDETKAEKFTDYIRQYVWGEYFGNYYVSKTGFGSEKSFNAFIANSTVTLGIKLPGIPLPHNYINDELVLMPYMRFEHVNNAEYSFWYQNQFFVAAGLRIMPFRTYRWKENEWLSKLAIFGEWDGIGGAQRVKQDGKVPYVPNYDLRFGVKFSSRRF
jgi:hypothetical protein